MPVTSPINVQVLEYFLSGYDDTEKQYLLEGFRYGFSLNYGGDQIGGIFKNHPSVLNNEEIVSNKLIQELQLDRIAGPFDDPPFHDFRSSPLGLVPKKEPGEFRVIHDLSYPKYSQGVSINSNISPENSTVSYDDLDYAISIIQQYGQACLVSKTELNRLFGLYLYDLMITSYWGSRGRASTTSTNVCQWDAPPHVAFLKPSAQRSSGL